MYKELFQWNTFKNTTYCGKGFEKTIISGSLASPVAIFPTTDDPAVAQKLCA